MSKHKYFPQVNEEGYFTGLSIADENPMRPGTYLLGKGAIDVEPPFRPPALNEAIRWDSDKNKWLYVLDYTAATLYSITDGNAIDPKTIKRGQSLKDMNATLLKPEPGQRWDAGNQQWVYTLEQLKQQKFAELAQLSAEMQSASIRVQKLDGMQDVTFDCDPEARLRLRVAIEDAQELETVTIKAAETFVDLTLEQLKQVNSTIIQYTQNCLNTEREHVQNIARLDKPEEVQKYNILSGWPI